MVVLGLLNKELNALNIENEFYEYTKKVPSGPYWVYEYIITDLSPESNKTEGVLILNGFSRKGLLELEKNKDTIISHFKNYAKIVDGIGIAINSGPAQYINTTNKEIKRIELKLDFKEWSV